MVIVLYLYTLLYSFCFLFQLGVLCPTCLIIELRLVFVTLCLQFTGRNDGKYNQISSTLYSTGITLLPWKIYKLKSLQLSLLEKISQQTGPLPLLM